MLLKKLKENYPLVYKEAVKEAENQGNHELITQAKSVASLFTWHKSRLGSDFWSLIDKSDVEEAEKIHPQLFVKPSVITSMTTNSLAYRCLVLSKKQ